jgi:two-component system NtrC family sensor kinase
MSGTVVVVDDSLTVRMDLVEAFGSAGFNVIPCSTAAEARRAISDRAVEVVVLDVLLPDANGVDLLGEIRASPNGKSVCVVMLSTENEVHDRIRGLQSGADEYVGKPYDARYLVARVQEFVLTRGGSGGLATILVIDDSLTFRESLRNALERVGHAVLSAGSGEDGLRLAGARRPDAIIVDGVLPGIDGAAVIRRVRLDAVLRDVPCLLLTASEAEQAELRALDAGADAFVRKEEDLDVILARLAAVLRRSKGRAPGVEEASSLLGLKKVLAVDDSATYLHQLADALEGEGYDVILARSGEEAIDLLAVQQVDCILLDLLMPGLNGQQTCQRIKAAPVVRDIPVIMLTALEDREAMIEGLSVGADDYISKSSELDVLKARVRAQLRRKQFEDENRRIREELLRKEHETAEAQAARRLAETKAMLADELHRANQELEAFSYSVSHDLRAPLRAIDGFSHMLLDEFGDTLDPRGRQYLDRVCSAAQRMSELIDDLLGLSRVGRAEIHRTSVDLSEVARQVVADLQKESDRRVEVVIQDNIVAHADRGLMRIVLENLLGNSWKFTGNVADTRIEFGTRQSALGLAYVVRDNGAGFDAKYVERLFRPFQRLHSDREFPGTGIGLATIRRIIERHGGRVWAEGAVGRGAQFFFSIPPVPDTVHE